MVTEDSQSAVHIQVGKRTVLISSEDGYRLAEYLESNGYRLSASSGYVAILQWSPRRHIAMLHRWLLGAPNHLVVDHINHDTLDNRRENIRLCTPSQNSQNSRDRLNTRSGVRGVFGYGRSWQASITTNGATKYLGSFKTKEEAGAAYARAAAVYHGDFRYVLADQLMGMAK